MTAAKLPSKDVIETIVNGITPQNNHVELIEQLRAKTNLLSILHAKTYPGFRRDAGVYESNNTLVHPNTREWLLAQIQSHSSNVYNTWSDLIDKNYLISISNGSLNYFIMQTGDAPADFIQLQVYHWQEVISHELVQKETWSRVTDEDDLTDFSGKGRGRELSNPIEIKQYYEFDKIFIASDLISKYNAIHNQFIKKHSRLILQNNEPDLDDFKNTTSSNKFPEISQLPSRVSRLMQDWVQSSAGMNGHIFSDHWYLNNSEWTNSSGQLSINIVPYWRTNKPIKKVVNKKNMTDYMVANIASKIDTKSGYPFSWYFYMLHGNRIGDWFGMRMLQAAESGAIFMTEHDYLVLKRWGANIYGF